MSKYKLSVGLLLFISIFIYLTCVLFHTKQSPKLTSREQVLNDVLGSINYNITPIPGFDGYYTVDDTTLELYRYPNGEYVSLGSMYGKSHPILIRGNFKSASLETLSKLLADAGYTSVYRVAQQVGTTVTLTDIDTKATFDIEVPNLDSIEDE